MSLRKRTRLSLVMQREFGRLSAIFWIPASAFVLRVIMRYRIKDVTELRERFRTLVRETDKPILICPNHLTMADSALVTWALGGSWWYLFRYRWVPWNLPEYHNFASNWLNRAAAWMVKCIPVVRGGPREHVSKVLNKIQHVHDTRRHRHHLRRGRPEPDGPRPARVDRPRHGSHRELDSGLSRPLRLPPG